MSDNGYVPSISILSTRAKGSSGGSDIKVGGDSTNPSAQIVEQPLTETFISPDNTLVDDTVALVDDTHALVGSQVTPTKDIKVKFKTNTPQAKIIKRR